MNKKILYVCGGLGLFLLTAGLSFVVFRNILGGEETIKTPLPEENKQGGFVIDPNAPKTEACPLNGGFYTKQEKAIWETRRPLGVMIENHQESRPQSGLSRADIVYEAVAEGGITRFLAIYYCDTAAYDTKLCPVRSARTYYLDWISEYDGLYAHVGGANCTPEVDARAKALCQIKDYGIKDIDQFGAYGSFPFFWRDYERLPHEVATEHTMCSTTAKLWGIGQKEGWEASDNKGIAWNASFKPWTYKDDTKTEAKAALIKFSFWKGYGDYDVQWDYDFENNQYKRSNGGQPHLDLNDNSQITAKVVAIVFAEEESTGDTDKHMLYQTKGTGKLLIFQDGQVTEGKWSKKDRVSRTMFLDKKGQEIKLNRGKIWLEIVPTGNVIEY